MNSIILNGIDSTTIQGLLIQSLPPITKPRIRAEAEEIDGRDGDLITLLGYGAYDKEFQIGLYGEYDIDQIIEYFNSSGVVTFSNENDKYYNYQIIEQIDFEKLMKFRTATVKMHVQPFKYSLADNSKTFTINQGTTSVAIRNSGNIYSKPIITITGTGSINLYLNQVQLFTISLGSTTSTIAIDINNMNAYNPSDNTFMNRQVVGNYDNFRLAIGKNIISWTGSITQIKLQNYSRWI
jgi:phage-related protein